MISETDLDRIEETGGSKILIAEIRRLREENERLRKAVNIVYDDSELENVEKERDRYRKALAQYADQGNWSCHETWDHSSCPKPCVQDWWSGDDVPKNGPEIAERALRGEEGE